MLLFQSKHYVVNILLCLTITVFQLNPLKILKTYFICTKICVHFLELCLKKTTFSSYVIPKASSLNVDSDIGPSRNFLGNIIRIRLSGYPENFPTGYYPDPGIR